jgi:hypothetical protein
MTMRFALIASVATGVVLLSGCMDGTETSETTSEPPRTLALAEDVALVGGAESGLGNQTLNITAEEENGNVTGEFWITDNVIKVECADTNTDGVVILGGAVTGGPDFAEGDLFALAIREDDPDSVTLYGNDSGAGSCIELLESIPEDSLADDSIFVDVEDGYDIETG